MPRPGKVKPQHLRQLYIVIRQQQRKPPLFPYPPPTPLQQTCSPDNLPFRYTLPPEVQLKNS